MLRPSNTRSGLKLPAQVQRELGIDSETSKFKTRGPVVPQGRKVRRRAERAEKKFARAQRGRVSGQVHDNSASREYKDGGASLGSELHARPVRRQSKDQRVGSKELVPLANPKPKSILKKNVQPRRAASSPSPEGFSLSRSSSPALVLDSSSKSFQDRAAQDDAEISALEKKLGLKTKKLPKSLDDDGLGDLLGGLDSDSESKKRKREEKEWLQRKRQRAEVDDGGRAEVGGLAEMDGMDSGISSEEDSDIDDAVESGAEAASEISDFEDFGSEDGPRSAPTPQPRRENPYIAPTSAQASVTKYIPPSRRNAADADNVDIQRLRRQIQGHLNKLSEANLVTILAEIEKLYQSQARQDVTSTLTDLLVSLFGDRSALQSTFVILHAALVAAAYKIIGTDFGAEMVSRLVERFDQLYPDLDKSSGKEAVNLISLISHLYTFHVIGSKLVFDYVRMLLEDITEAHAELLLRVVRDVGPQLRQDDPSSLKDIVRIMQNSVAKLEEASGREVSVRTKFMIETITDLKNNKIKAAASVNGIAVEHISRMRKALGTLNMRNVRASEPLRIGRQDIKDTDKKGKWWLVGASWKGNTEANGPEPGSLAGQLVPRHSNLTDPQDADLLALAREYGMNTAIRRSVFIAIMSASDFQDAHVRLLQLRLKRSQELEIPKVLLRCAGAESTYNPYYTLIAKKLCTDRKMKMAFQFSLWNFFKRMGERDGMDESESDDDEAEAIELTEIVNLAKMYAGLVTDGALSLAVLKALNLAYLKEQAHMFVELLLVVVVLQSQQGLSNGYSDKVLHAVFSRVADAPQIINGLHHFIKKVVGPSDLPSSPKEQAILKWGSKVAMDTLERLRLNDAEVPAL